MVQQLDSNPIIRKIEKEAYDEIYAMHLEQASCYDRPVFEDSSLNITATYPISDKWEYETRLTRINLDEERKKDILSGRGFIIADAEQIQKEIKSPNGIFSPRFGQTLSDANPFIDKYRCTCGALRSRFYNGITCKVCNTKVRFVDDDFEYFGWLVLQKFWLIHPNLYKSIENLIGPQRLINILDFYDEKDQDGHSLAPNKRRSKSPKRKNKGEFEPFYGLGMVEFKNRFEEICDYYLNNTPNKGKKQEYYDDIMENRDKIFTQSIPVFTTLLRPFNVNDKSFSFEKTNAIYNMMSNHVTRINRSNRKMNRHFKTKNDYLFKLQMKWQELYLEIDNILSGKKGNVRLLSGGRLNFSSRDVIIQNPFLKIDQVTLPYQCLVDILQQQIINILTKTYSMSYSQAYDKWYRANIKKDEEIVNIIYALIKSANNGQGLPVIINRNPSISRGSLLQMFCVGMTFNYTMAVPLQVLPLLAADFDGDVLNVYYIISSAFFKRANQVLNPKNSMYISNNDGKLNPAVIPDKDTLINSTAMIRLSRHKYTPEQLELIAKCKATRV